MALVMPCKSVLLREFLFQAVASGTFTIVLPDVKFQLYAQMKKRLATYLEGKSSRQVWLRVSLNSSTDELCTQSQRPFPLVDP